MSKFIIKLPPQTEPVGMRSPVNEPLKHPNKGGRPTTLFPRPLAVLMEDKGIAANWVQFGQLFEIDCRSSYKMLYQKQFAGVEQFIIAAEKLNISPRRLLDIIKSEQAKFNSLQEKKRAERNGVKLWAAKKIASVRNRA